MRDACTQIPGIACETQLLSLSLSLSLTHSETLRERETDRQRDTQTHTALLEKKWINKSPTVLVGWDHLLWEKGANRQMSIYLHVPSWGESELVDQSEPELLLAKATRTQRTWTCQPQVTRTCMSTANDKLSARRWFGTCRLVRSEPVLTNHLNNHEAYEPYLTDGAYSASVSPSPGRLPCPAWAAQAQPDSSSRSSAAGFSTYRPAWAWRFPTDPKTASPKAGWKVWG